MGFEPMQDLTPVRFSKPLPYHSVSPPHDFSSHLHVFSCSSYLVGQVGVEPTSDARLKLAAYTNSATGPRVYHFTTLALTLALRLSSVSSRSY